MQQNQIQELAHMLHSARKEGQSISQISKSVDFTREEAYQIQEAGIEMRKAEGEKLVGIKMGLTSEAKRKQMDLDSPLYGELTDTMQIAAGGTFSLQGSIHPKIEPEVAFQLKNPLQGEVTREQVLEQLEWIAPALEILDSRYDGFKYFSMEDVIADNSSSSHFIVGKAVTDFSSMNMKELTIKMKVNGEVVQEGLSSAISGDPLVSVIQLAELLAKRNRSIPANRIILAGAATVAHPLSPDETISLEISGFEDLVVHT